MKERPILMHARSINGILEGRKTQTRRIIKQPICFGSDNRVLIVDGLRELKCPYGQPGDRLWIRERFLYRNNRQSVVFYAGMDPVEAAGFGAMYGGWKPSIHMPRWASRLTLEITGIRVERVQDISEKDAKAEGCRSADPATGREVLLDDSMGSYRLHFQSLWDDTNGKGAFERNDWCWVVDFRRLP